MRFAIISDTHDNMKSVKMFVNRIETEEIDIILHAGDIVAPFVIKELAKVNVPIYAVFGNNDGEKIFLSKLIGETGGQILPSPQVFEIANKKILMMHEPYILEYEKYNSEYDIIIYGHTHKKEISKYGNRWVINPGTLGGYLAPKKTFVIWDTQANKIEEKEI